ncbi:ERVV2 protein, partial [Hydrobates tethys]|nr:ERVV2 protein [Oceanodroma tethys]
TGFHSFVRALIPMLGVAQLEQAMVNLSAEMEEIANRTVDAILGIQQEIQTLEMIVWQNREVLDILTAQAGGVCTLINETCCAFVDNNKRILTDVQ